MDRTVSYLSHHHIPNVYKLTAKRLTAKNLDKAQLFKAIRINESSRGCTQAHICRVLQGLSDQSARITTLEGIKEVVDEEKRRLAEADEDGFAADEKFPVELARITGTWTNVRERRGKRRRRSEGE